MASQGTSNPLKHKMYSRAEWELVKPLIRVLYLQEAWTYKGIAKYLSDHHNFEPTENQFKKKILEWKFRKYTTGAERREIAQSFHSDDPIFVRGQVVDKAKLKRWEKQGRSTTSITRVRSHKPCKTIPSMLGDENSILATFEEPVQNCNQLCGDATRTFSDVDMHHDEPQNILINILDTSDYAELIGFLTLEALNGTPLLTDSTQSDGCKDVSETLDETFSQDKAVRSPEENMGSLPYKANLIKQKMCQNQNDYFSRWKMGSFLHTFPRATRIVAGIRDFHVMPAESAARIIPECSREFQRLSILAPEEIIRLVDNMWGIADTYYTVDCLPQAEIWYRRIVTAKQKILHYDPLGTLRACLRVVMSISYQGRYLDAIYISRDFYLQIQRVLPAHHYLIVSLRQTWANLLALTNPGSTELEACRRENLQISLSALGIRHEYTFDDLIYLGLYLLSIGSYSECEAIFRAGLDIIHENEAEHGHNWTLEARFGWRLMLRLASVLRFQSKFCEAQNILENAKSRYEHLMEVGTDDWFGFYYDMAALKRNTGDLAASEKFLLRIFQQTRRSSCLNSVEAYAISLMASVLRDSGRGEEAATWYKKLFDIHVKSYGIQSTQALSSCEDWGFCYTQLGSFGKAISVFEKVIQDIELGQGRGLELPDQCLQRLRGFIAEVMEMQEEEEASEVDEMSHHQYMSEDEEMPDDGEMPGGEEMLNDDDDIIEDIDLYGA